MKLLSQSKLSGDFIFQYINLLPERLNYLMENGEKVDFEYFYHLKNDILNLPHISELFDFYAEEPFLNPTDIVLFNKFVLHRSVPLLDGNISSRIALALRFVDVNSQYDYDRAQAQEYPKKYFDYAGSSSFNVDVCHSDGERLIDSQLFLDTLEKRIIKG